MSGTKASNFDQLQEVMLVHMQRKPLAVQAHLVPS